MPVADVAVNIPRRLECTPHVDNYIYIYSNMKIIKLLVLQITAHRGPMRQRSVRQTRKPDYNTPYYSIHHIPSCIVTQDFTGQRSPAVAHTTKIHGLSHTEQWPKIDLYKCSQSLQHDQSLCCNTSSTRRHIRRHNGDPTHYTRRPTTPTAFGTQTT